MLDPVLLESERSLELEAIDLGIERYRKWRERGDLGKPEQDLVGAGLRRVEESIESIRKRVLDGSLTAGNGYAYWGPVIAYLPAEMMAGAALMAAFEAMTKTPRGREVTLQSVIQRIADATETVLALLKARDMDRELYRILSKTIKRWDRRRSRRFYKKVTGLSRPLNAKARAHVGGFLLSHVLTTGWFVINKTRRQSHTVSLDPEVSTHLAGEHSSLEVLAPMLYPMVIPPADWGPDKRGGYIYHERPIFKPVNPGDKAPSLGDAPAVYEAINTLQRTEWAVNAKVLEVMTQVWEAGGGWAGLPRLNPIDVEREVPRRDDITDDELKLVKCKRAELHRTNALEVGLRLEQLHRLRAARKLASAPFYHVWQMDWRGRLYPLASVLNPEGGDLDRGLLTFARAVPQDDVGREWIAIHLANLWGGAERIDKAPFAARVAWVAERRDRIRAVAAEPLEHKWWAEADSPWQFLAACIEYSRGDGLTQLPVAVDGSCNGLQHYSALGRDEVGGRAVNLVPQDRPSRIYEDVAEGVRSLLARAGAGEVPVPEVTDKVVKRAVMTLPYGLTPIGMRDQFIEDGWVTQDKGKCAIVEDGKPVFADPYASATRLRDLTMEAISTTVVKAVEYMNWLKSTAKIANEKGIPLAWTAPTGMRVTQDYVIPDFNYVTLPGLGKDLKFRTMPTDRRLNATKQTNGICPNFIHTHDAAHLMLTVNAAYKVGVIAFHMIHDSFGTHAPMVPTLGRVLREQFVGIYKEDVIGRFKQENEQRLGVELPPLPVRGTLDLDAVIRSRYAFA